MDWTTCKKKDLVKEIKIDKNLIIALIKSSSKKLHTQDLFELNDDTASSKISLVYEGVRELLEALAVSKGYKIYNHECYCAFLKEILSESGLGSKFDDFRKLRNAINYYGKDVSREEAKIVLDEMLVFIGKIKAMLKSYAS